MKDEIKEILDYFRTYATIKEVNMIKKLKDYITKQQKLLDFEIERNDIKQEIIDKAIEYIEEHIKYECDGTYSGMSFYSHHLYDNFKKEDLLNILQGSDDNEHL